MSEVGSGRHLTLVSDFLAEYVVHIKGYISLYMYTYFPFCIVCSTIFSYPILSYPTIYPISYPILSYAHPILCPIMYPIDLSYPVIFLLSILYDSYPASYPILSDPILYPISYSLLSCFLLPLISSSLVPLCIYCIYVYLNCSIIF